MMRPAFPKSHNSGFTLIEVVVALAILGGGLLILLEGHFASLRLLDEAQNAAIFSTLIEAAAADAERQVLSGTTSGDGDFGRRLEQYTYTFGSVQPDEGNAPGLFEISVTIRGPLDEKEIVFYAYDAHQLTEQSGSSGTAGSSLQRRNR